LKNKEESDSLSNSKNQLIETELMNMIKSDDKSDLHQFGAWIQTQWDILSENINKQRINVDI